MTQAHLEVSRITKQFGSITAVDDITLAIPRNERHAIIGPNGAGKTTLFDLITGVLSPDTGSIHYNGEDITRVREDKRARNGIVRSFQLAELFDDLSIHDNLRLGVQSTRQDFNPFGATDPTVRDRVDEIYGSLGITANPATLAKTLSHGDRKRLEVGIALATNPSVLLLDEPTSGVPHSDSTALIREISAITTDRTVLLIEHDIDIALTFADQVTVMDQGCIIAQGPPDSIVNNDAVQNAYLRGYHVTVES